jgi:hypothetical protein
VKAALSLAKPFLSSDNASFFLVGAPLAVSDAACIVSKAALPLVNGSFFVSSSSLLARRACFVVCNVSLITGSDSLVVGKASLLVGRAPFLVRSASVFVGDASLVEDSASVLEDNGSPLDIHAPLFRRQRTGFRWQCVAPERQRVVLAWESVGCLSPRSARRSARRSRSNRSRSGSNLSSTGTSTSTATPRTRSDGPRRSDGVPPERLPPCWRGWVSRKRLRASGPPWGDSDRHDRRKFPRGFSAREDHRPVVREDGGLEFANAAMGFAPDRFAREVGKPALHLVER